MQTINTKLGFNIFKLFNISRNKTYEPPRYFVTIFNLKALVLERNKMVSRRTARILGCAGMAVVVLEDPEQVPGQLEGVQLLCADSFDGDLVAGLLREHPSLRAILWTAEPLEHILRFVLEEPRISNVFGRPNFESTPQDWELLMIARRLQNPTGKIPSFASCLSWGASGFQEKVRDTAGMQAAVTKVQEFVARGGVPKRTAEMFGELTHELLMNAVYDAPVDANGQARFAHDRKAEVSLSEAEAATLRLASDGVRLCIQVADPFGRLQRHHVFGGLVRGFKGGEMDQSGGGAGLGMMVCHNSTTAMVYDVTPGHKTEVTGFFDLDLNLRAFRSQAKSLHYFEQPAGQPAQQGR